MRTIAGLGEWIGVIYSAELYNAAINHGYTFEILEGYLFKKGDIFSSFVNNFCSLKLFYDKTNPMNLISKLIMNSLYGKFSVSLTYDSMQVLDISTHKKLTYAHAFLEKLAVKGEVKDSIFIEGKVLIIILDGSLSNRDEENQLTGIGNSNVAIGSAITSHARAYMSFFKTKALGGRIPWYTDTDSIVADIPLPDKYMGPALGQFKLESKIVSAVFLAPKWLLIH